MASQPLPLKSKCGQLRQGFESRPQRPLKGLVLLLGMVGLAACNASDAQLSKTGKAGGKGPIPVVVARVTQQTVPLSLQTTGTVQAYATVSVTSQMAGQLLRVAFKEGQEVRKGDLLFTLDSRPLRAALDGAIANRTKAVAQVSQAQAALAQAQAQVKQAQANLAKDIAQNKNAAEQAQRYTSLLNQGAVSRDQASQFRTSAASQSAVVDAGVSDVNSAVAAVESAKANVESAQAAVEGTDAAIDSAKVQLSYSAIYAPIDGQTGSLKVNQGNLVKQNDTTPLVVISQIRPIYVTLSVPQRLLSDLKKYQAQGSLKVIVPSPRADGQPLTGEVAFVDSGLDATTGTIQLKARFDNASGQLTPGQFVKVSLQLTQQPNAIVVPTPAVQVGQKGSFVYVVKPNQTVELRPVVPGEAVARQTVIQKGLKPGESVVIDGQFNLVPGAAVREKPAAENPSQPQKQPRT